MMVCISRIESYPVFTCIISGTYQNSGPVGPIVCKQLIKDAGGKIISFEYKVEDGALSIYARVNDGYIICKTVPFMVRYESQDFKAIVATIPSGTTAISITE